MREARRVPGCLGKAGPGQAQEGFTACGLGEHPVPWSCVWSAPPQCAGVNAGTGRCPSRGFAWQTQH